MVPLFALTLFLSASLMFIVEPMMGKLVLPVLGGTPAAQIDDTLGWVYYKKGLGTLAVSSFERAAASQPSNQVYLLHLGRAYALAGEGTKARETLEKALKIAPASPQASEIKKALGAL